MADGETHDFVVGGLDALIEDFAGLGWRDGIVFRENTEKRAGDLRQIDGSSANFHACIAEIIRLVTIFDVLPIDLAGEFDVIDGPMFHSEKGRDEIFVFDFSENLEPFRDALYGRHGRKARFHELNGDVAISIDEGIDIESRWSGPGGENATFGEVDGRGLSDEIT